MTTSMRSTGIMSFITGVGLTSYGRHEGSSSLDLMSQAASWRSPMPA